MAWHAAALIALTVGSASAQFVAFDPVDGLSGAVPASNAFDEDFFWGFKGKNLSRAGFEDGTVDPYMIYPDWYEVKGAEAKVTEHAGHDSALKCFWTSAARNDHFEIRDFSGARDELWWSFDLYVPEADPEDPDAPSYPDDHSTMISQIWRIGPQHDWSLMVGLKINNNSLKVLNHGGPSIGKAVEDIPRGEWNRVVLQVIPSIDDNGSLRVWYGGQKVAEKTGIYVASSGAGEEHFTDDDTLAEENRMIPWFGIYTDSGNEDRTLFFDNVISYAGKHNQSALRVEAEHYNRYEDETEGNQGARNNQGGYRPDEAVDIAFYWKGKTSNGYKDSCYYVGWTEENESLEYDIEIPQAGSYRFKLRAACPGGKGKVALSVDKGNDGSTKLGDITVPNTLRGDSRECTFTTVSGPVVSLEPGEYTVTLDVKNGGFKLDCWEAELKR